MLMICQEMRRRTWALVRMSDVVFSHQVSLPSMIYEHNCDTKLPNNIFDEDFHPDIKELPPSRPPTEPTPIDYMIAKTRLCNELGNILQASAKVERTILYDEVVRFDAKLRQIVQELPPHLKLTTLEGSQDPVTLIIARFNIDILYQKIMCLLHRKYIAKARQNSRYTFSRRSAIEASLKALDHLDRLYRESQFGGRLRSVPWYVKSVATKDFTLPAMIVILDLHYDNISAQGGASRDDCALRLSQEQRCRMLQSLVNVQRIWSHLADESMEAFKASKVIDIMLQKINSPEQSDYQGNSTDSRTGSLSTLATSSEMNPTPATSQGLFTPVGVQNLNTPEMNPFMASNSSAFLGMDFGLPLGVGTDFQGDPLNAHGAPSPLSMFTNLGGAAPDMSANFDWVGAIMRLQTK